MSTGLISISPKNSKLGNIPSISLVPGRDCGNCSACIRGCYARKLIRLYPATDAAWARNSKLARRSQRAYFRQLDGYMAYRRPRFFRFHVGGDILNQTYLNNMIKLAIKYPETLFLAFTKMFHLDFSHLPANLTIIASMWPGLELPAAAAHLPKAWMQDGTEDRIPADAIECPGNCESCGMCWALPNIGRDVVFHKH